MTPASEPMLIVSSRSFSNSATNPVSTLLSPIIQPFFSSSRFKTACQACGNSGFEVHSHAWIRIISDTIFKLFPKCGIFSINCFAASEVIYACDSTMPQTSSVAVTTRASLDPILSEVFAGSEMTSTTVPASDATCAYRELSVAHPVIRNIGLFKITDRTPRNKISFERTYRHHNLTYAAIASTAAAATSTSAHRK